MYVHIYIYIYIYTYMYILMLKAMAGSGATGLSFGSAPADVWSRSAVELYQAYRLS